MAKVLGVDDDPATLRIIETHLRLNGHEMVLKATGLPEALDMLPKIKELGVRIAIIDGAFPNRGDGAFLAAALRAETPCVKVISLSGEKEPQTWGDMNLMKPSGFYQLRQAIEELLKA